MSKENDTVCAMRSTRPPRESTTGPKIVSRWLTSMFTRPRPVICTPLGRPVDPEVKIV